MGHGRISTSTPNLLFFGTAMETIFGISIPNDASGDRKLLRLNLPEADQDDITPSFHFVSGGEMHAVLSLVQTFKRCIVP